MTLFDTAKKQQQKQTLSVPVTSPPPLLPKQKKNTHPSIWL